MRSTNDRHHFRSVCMGDVHTGYADFLVKKYESMAYQAEREKDHVAAHVFFQYAEHYKKV